MQVERGDVLEILRASHIFHSLTNEQLSTIVDQVEAFLYAEKQVIFEQDGLSDSFYFILSGRVDLVRRRRDEEDQVVLESHDYFGEEVLADNPGPRLATATARTNVILLRLTADAMEDFRKSFPKLDGPFRLILESYTLAMNTRMPWRGPREIVHYIARHHPIFLFLRLVLPTLFALITVGASTFLEVVLYPGATIPLVILLLVLLGNAAWFAWVIIDFYNDYSVVTNRRVAFLSKMLLIYDSRQEVPLDAVLADDVRTSQVGRIIGYGDIVVRTYTGEIILARLARPQLIINLINEMRDRARASRRQARLETIDHTIRRRIGLPDTPPPSKDESDPRRASQKPGKLGQFLSDLFMLRVERDGAIQYRTHWVILLKKTGLPALLTLLVVLFLLLSLLGILPFAPVTALIVFVALFPVVGLWLLYQFVDWRNDRYIITRDMIVDLYKKPLGTEQKRSAPLKNILSIDFERIGLIGLILNFGTVYVRVGDSTLTFDNVMAPSEVQRELFQRFMEFKQREEDRADQTMNEQLADWIEHYHRLIQDGQATSNPPESG